MNLRDIVIIYLACGAPLAVYYFLQNRRRQAFGANLFKTLIRFVLWIPFGIALVARKSLFTNLYRKSFASGAESDSRREAEIAEIRRHFESFAARSLADGPGLFEIREVFDRYVGLSDEMVRAVADDGSDDEPEILGLSNHNAKKVGAACLARRNRLRLAFHQKLAARDLAGLAAGLAPDRAARQESEAKLERLARLVDDGELPKALNAARETAANDIIGEEYLWKSENRPSSIDAANQQISGLRPAAAAAAAAATTTTNLSSGD